MGGKCSFSGILRLAHPKFQNSGGSTGNYFDEHLIRPANGCFGVV